MKKLRKDPIPYLMSRASPLSKLKVFVALGETDRPESADIIMKIKASQGLDGSWGRPALVNGTAYVLYLLLEMNEPKSSNTSVNAAKWLLSRQRLDGGWTETVSPPRYVEEVVPTDSSCTWITAHIVQALIRAGFKEDDCVKEAVDYLKTSQNADGGWGAWGRGKSVLSIMDYIVKALVDYGEPTSSSRIENSLRYALSLREQWTPFDASAVLPCLLIGGYKPTDKPVEACLKVLADSQNEDGGWTYPTKTRGSDPELTTHIVYWLAKCGYRFKLPL